MNTFQMVSMAPAQNGWTMCAGQLRSSLWNFDALGLQNSYFFNLVNLLKAKNLRKCLANFLDVSKLYET